MFCKKIQTGQLYPCNTIQIYAIRQSVYIHVFFILDISLQHSVFFSSAVDIQNWEKLQNIGDDFNDIHNRKKCLSIDCLMKYMLFYNFLGLFVFTFIKYFGVNSLFFIMSQRKRCNMGVMMFSWLYVSSFKALIFNYLNATIICILYSFSLMTKFY